MKSKLVAALLFSAVAFAAGPPALVADMDALIADVAKWTSGQPLNPLNELEQQVRVAVADPKARAQIEGALIKLLSPETTFEAKRFACQQLAVVGSDAALPALAPLLQDNETAGLVGFALGNRPSAKADQLLRDALATAQDRARLQILATLGNRRDEKAVDLLSAQAAAADVPVAQTAIIALGKIGTPAARKALAALNEAARPALAPALADASLRCVERLQQAGHHRDAAVLCERLLAPDQPAYVRRGAFAALLRGDRDGGEQRLRQTLRGNDAVLRAVAIAAVPELPAQTASETLGRELPGLTAEEQVWLIDSLAARSDAAARTAITTALAASAHGEVRQAAARALGRIGEPSTARALAQALAAATDEPEVNAVMAALSGLPGGTATDRAILTEVNAAAGRVRAQLITSLATRRSPEVLAALLAEAGHPEPLVAKAAYRVLARAATAETLPPLLQQFMAIRDPDLRADAETFVEQALGQVESPAARSAAVRQSLAVAPNPETRQALLRLLPACGDAEALGALTAALATVDAPTRPTAVRALAEWPNDAAWPPLAALYQQPGNETERDLALRGLVRLMKETDAAGDTQTERYRTLLAGARGNAELKQILGAMGGAKEAGVLQLALPLLDRADVRAEAAAAVKRIAEAIKPQAPVLAQEALKRLEQAP